MPRQRVTPHLRPVLRRPRHQPVTGRIIELPLTRLRRIRLHLVLSRDHVELTRRDRGIRTITQLVAQLTAATEIPATLRRRRAQSVPRRIRQRHRQRPRDQAHARRGNHIDRPPTPPLGAMVHREGSRHPCLLMIAPQPPGSGRPPGDGAPQRLLDARQEPAGWSARADCDVGVSEVAIVTMDDIE